MSGKYPDFEHVNFVRMTPRNQPKVPKVSTLNDDGDSVSDLEINPSTEMSDEVELLMTDLNTNVLKLSRQNILLKQQINELTKLVKQQHETILKLFEEQKQEILEIAKKQIRPVKKKNYSSYFPIKTQKELDEIEAFISDENKEILISTIRRIIPANGLVKHLHRIFATELIIEYNFQGVKQKKRLQDYKKLLDVIYNGTQCEGWSQEVFFEELRRSIKLKKGSHFKQIYLKRKKQQMLQQAQEENDVEVKNEMDDFFYADCSSQSNITD